MSYMRNIFHHAYKMRLQYVHGGHLIAVPSIYSNAYNINEVGDALTDAYNSCQKELKYVEKYGKLPDKQPKKSVEEIKIV